jgi:DNA (cytosine-5)-methyltransferase 1
MRPRLLDLFCGGGGASAGYHAAGFDVTGVDIEPQPYYPFDFIEGNAMTVDLSGYDVVAASPPCQRWSIATPTGRRGEHPDLLAPIRDRLIARGGPYVIENVPGAPLRSPVIVCGETLRLGVRRHRLFESNVPIVGTPCLHDRDEPSVPVYGSYGQSGSGGVDVARGAMGIDWLPWPSLTQAVPPLYTYGIGLQLMTHIIRDGWDLDRGHCVTSPTLTKASRTQPSRGENLHMGGRRCPRWGCGAPLVRPPTGRWPRYCSHACRQAAYRLREAAQGRSR